MDVLNWILLSIGGICFALVLLLLWLGPPSRHHSTLLQMLPSKSPLTHEKIRALRRRPDQAGRFSNVKNFRAVVLAGIADDATRGDPDFGDNFVGLGHRK